MAQDGLTPDRRRFPLVTAEGWANYRRIRQHPFAPLWNHTCGNRLSAAGLESVRAFAREIKTNPPYWSVNAPPPWLAEFCAYCYREVPFYRAYGLLPECFEDIPTCGRADLGAEPWRFVPDDQPLDELIVYSTSGTSGHPIDILFHPTASAMYEPLLWAALERYGVTLAGGPDKTACILVCYQKSTYTLVSLVATLEQAGFAKINLNLSEWRDPGDRVRFLDDLKPQIYTGDPIAFAELAKLPLKSKPRALISSAMHLSPGLRTHLEERFGCPVLDLYALNECGPLALATPAGEGFELLSPRVYVEILDAQGHPCPPGKRGEITLSGGLSPFLPLLRYRSGDYAALEVNNGRLLLTGLQGRSPVVFRSRQGQPVNNIDVTIALRHLSLSHYRLHQAANGDLKMTQRGAAGPARVRAALLELFGTDQTLEIEVENDQYPPTGKQAQYTSELDT